MRNLRPILASLIVVCAFGGNAVAVDRSINLTATVNSFCKVEGSTANSTDPVTVDWTSQISGGVFATTTASTKSVAVICNKAADVALISTKGGMTDTSVTADASFDDIIRYSAAASGTFVTIAAGTTSGTTQAGATANESLGTASSAGPKSDTITVTLTPVGTGTGKPLFAGTYTDTLIVRVTPQ